MSIADYLDYWLENVIQAWVDDLKVIGYSRQSIRGYLGCLSSAMTYAILPLKYIQSNPCAPVKIGKMPVDVKAKEKMLETYTWYYISRKRRKSQNGNGTPWT